MKYPRGARSGSFIIPLAASASIVGGPSVLADCHDAEVRKAESLNHIRELCAAAESGNAGAMYWLGLAYIEGQVLNDYDKGLRWLKKASFRGNEEAQRVYDFISSAEIGPEC